MDGTAQVAVTGAGGFLGWHLRCRLKRAPGLLVKRVFRQDFETLDRLSDVLGRTQTVFHLAGMNRGPEEEVYATNLRLADALIETLERSGARPTILFANSIHSAGDTAFGRAKRDAAARLSAWAERSGARFVDVVLPHLFGEGGRPFYNSAFATFCHQLAMGEEPQIQTDGEVELVHAQRACNQVMALADGSFRGQVRITGTKMRVSEALERLRRIHSRYQEGVIPGLADPLDLDFFNTYRSYLYPGRYPFALRLHSDARGALFEAVKTDHGGQAFLSTTHPGITRGRHYHHHKVERFLVVSGEAEIRIRRLFGDEVKVFSVSGDAPCAVDIPTLHTHEITNTGTRDLLTLFWSHEIFDPAAPDTYPEPVIVEP